MLAGTLTAVLCTAAPWLALAGSAHPQLYLSPPPPRLAHSAHGHDADQARGRLELDAPQTNAVLASHLGVSHHLPLPASKGKDGRLWEAALDDSPWAHDPSHARIVVVLECPKSGCTDALPAEFAAQRALDLAPLPAHSYLAALSLHLHRLADSLGLDPDSHAVQGLQDLVDNGVKSVAGWQGWIGDELARWVGFHGDTSNGRDKVRPAVEPPARGSRLVDDLDLLDASSAQLVLELNKLAVLADGVPTSASHAHAGSDSGPQGANDLPKVVVIHLKGLKDIAAKHSLSSPTYQRAVALTRDTLTGTLASLRARLTSPHNGATTASSDEPTVMLLALPPHAQPLLRKRDMWLKPFEGRSIAAATKRYAGSRAEAVGGQQLKKRSVFSPRAEGDDGEGEGDKAPSQVVAAGKTCFSSLAHLNNATASCLGRGHGVRGISTRANADGNECWVCKCGVTEDDEGRRTSWAGEGCEKKDLSGSALLLALTTLGLALAIAGSVALLYNIGSVPLPGTLSAVSGMGPGGAKRD
ncbi:hypothetical protein JCM3775_001917 [Rhodotorula graminis]